VQMMITNNNAFVLLCRGPMISIERARWGPTGTKLARRLCGALCTTRSIAAHGARPQWNHSRCRLNACLTCKHNRLSSATPHHTEHVVKGSDHGLRSSCHLPAGLAFTVHSRSGMIIVVGHRILRIVGENGLDVRIATVTAAQRASVSPRVSVFILIAVSDHLCRK